MGDGPMEPEGGTAKMRRWVRQNWAGLGFAAVAVLVIPLCAGVLGRGARTLAAGPLGVVVRAFDGPRNRASFERIEAFREPLRAAADEAEVDPFLLGGIVFAESRGRSGQTSSRGALGLMQLVLPAARDAARRIELELPGGDVELTERLLHDDALNLQLGAAHLAWLLKHRGDWSLEAVLVSYNAGRRRLFQWIERDGSYDAWAAKESALDKADKPSTGALAYARRVLGVRDALRERGRL